VLLLKLRIEPFLRIVIPTSARRLDNQNGISFENYIVVNFVRPVRRSLFNGKRQFENTILRLKKGAIAKKV
jgi:hypothetical protein